MASPQIENGYTAIANEILEKLCLLGLNGTQFRIVMTVWRYTYGFKQKKNALSISFLSKATGVHRITLSQELSKLINMNIISVTSGSTYTKAREISFNKNYDSYQIGKQLANRTTVSEPTNTTVSELTTTTVSESTNQKIKHKTNNKENIYAQKNCACAFFDDLWKLYPRKMGKGSVSKKALSEINTIGFENMAKAIERYKDEIYANGTAEQYIMYGSTFFNGGYLDYLEPADISSAGSSYEENLKKAAAKAGVTVEEFKRIMNERRNL